MFLFIPNYYGYKNFVSVVIRYKLNKFLYGQGMWYNYDDFEKQVLLGMFCLDF